MIQAQSLEEVFPAAEHLHARLGGAQEGVERVCGE